MKQSTLKYNPTYSPTIAKGKNDELLYHDPITNPMQINYQNPYVEPPIYTNKFNK